MNYYPQNYYHQISYLENCLESLNDIVNVSFHIDAPDDVNDVESQVASIEKDVSKSADRSIDHVKSALDEIVSSCMASLEEKLEFYALLVKAEHEKDVFPFIQWAQVFDRTSQKMLFDFSVKDFFNALPPELWVDNFVEIVKACHYLEYPHQGELLGKLNDIFKQKNFPTDFTTLLLHEKSLDMFACLQGTPVVTTLSSAPLLQSFAQWQLGRHSLQEFSSLETWKKISSSAVLMDKFIEYAIVKNHFMDSHSSLIKTAVVDEFIQHCVGQNLDIMKSLNDAFDSKLASYVKAQNSDYLRKIDHAYQYLCLMEKMPDKKDLVKKSKI